jgi:hypothetical protein
VAGLTGECGTVWTSAALDAVGEKIEPASESAAARMQYFIRLLHMALGPQSSSRGENHHSI